VGEQALLLASAGPVLAAPEQQQRSEVEIAGHLRERIGIDEARADARQIALGRVGKALVAADGDREPENGVAEELEALVRSGDLAREPALVDVAAVPQRLQRDFRPERSGRKPQPLFEQGDALRVGEAIRDQAFSRAANDRLRCAPPPPRPYRDRPRAGRCAGTDRRAAHIAGRAWRRLRGAAARAGSRGARYGREAFPARAVRRLAGGACSGPRRPPTRRSPPRRGKRRT